MSEIDSSGDNIVGRAVTAGAMVGGLLGAIFFGGGGAQELLLIIPCAGLGGAVFGAYAWIVRKYQ